MQSGPEEDTRAEGSQMSYIGEVSMSTFAPEGGVSFIIVQLANLPFVSRHHLETLFPLSEAVCSINILARVV